eukprot:830075-Amphidinium_carterae.1
MVGQWFSYSNLVLGLLLAAVPEPYRSVLRNRDIGAKRLERQCTGSRETMDGAEARPSAGL